MICYIILVLTSVDAIPYILRARSGTMRLSELRNLTPEHRVRYIWYPKILGSHWRTEYGAFRLQSGVGVGVFDRSVSSLWFIADLILLFGSFHHCDAANTADVSETHTASILKIKYAE
jgi:hypothetical protein